MSSGQLLSGHDVDADRFLRQQQITLRRQIPELEGLELVLRTKQFAEPGSVSSVVKGQGQSQGEGSGSGLCLCLGLGLGLGLRIGLGC